MTSEICTCVKEEGMMIKRVLKCQAGVAIGRGRRMNRGKSCNVGNLLIKAKFGGRVTEIEDKRN